METDATTVIVLMICFFSSILGMTIASSRGVNALGGFILGLLLGPLGVGIVLLMGGPTRDVGSPPAEPLPGTGQASETYIRCASCSGFTPSHSIFCNHCGGQIVG